MKKQWISIKCGLSRDPNHRRAMGEGIWLYMHMLDLCTWDDGIVHKWKDEIAAADMNMPIRTLREHRRKLEELGYINCKKNKYDQDIAIHNWTNPREYSGKVYNEKQSSTQSSMITPLSDIQSSIKTEPESNRKHGTPTYSSTLRDSTLKAAAKPKTATPDEVKLFRETTERFPPKINYDDVVSSIANVRARIGRDVTRDDLLPFYKKWCALGYKPINMSWLEWAESGQIPTNGNRKPNNQNYQEPKGFDAGRKFLERHGVKQNG